MERWTVGGDDLRGTLPSDEHASPPIAGAYRNFEPARQVRGWIDTGFFGIPVAGQANAGGEPFGMPAGVGLISFA